MGFNDTNPFQNCTSVTPACPVSATTYGYTPSLGGNAFLLAIFLITFIAQISLGLKFRLPSFGIVMTIGTGLEFFGYIGRIMLHNNVWSSAGFQMQIICLIIAPSFLAAGIYLTLKHIVLALGEEMSRLKPKLYTWIFISCDAASIFLQAIGGGVAAGANSIKTINAGNDLMIGGIAAQVGTMGICLLLALDFGFTLFRTRKVQQPNDEKIYSTTKGFYFYLSCTSAAFVFIFIRCIYRLPEMASGWGSSLMREEAAFMVLDGGMVALACILMTVAHPGFFFPEMRVKSQKK